MPRHSALACSPMFLACLMLQHEDARRYQLTIAAEDAAAQAAVRKELMAAQLAAEDQTTKVGEACACIQLFIVLAAEGAESLCSNSGWVPRVLQCTFTEEHMMSFCWLGGVPCPRAYLTEEEKTRV
eukprot:1136765-Pelagomonas_calceolata.AAC.3